MSDAREDLTQMAASLVTPKLNERYGYVAVRDAEIMGLAIAATLATITANPREAFAAMGYPERGKADCPDPWVCCLHPLSDEERRNA